MTSAGKLVGIHAGNRGYPPNKLICLLVPCSDSICASEVQGAATECSQANQCSYTFQYGDGSGTTGYYISDAVYFDMILGQSSLANSSATVVFGCSNYLSGELTKSDKAVDGIIGRWQWRRHTSSWSYFGSKYSLYTTASITVSSSALCLL
nr:aspartic proteinase-like protein 2 [Arachis hypogaea]